ncbi:beta-carotene hydroxylase [Tahibacter aquaticus]|uniref:Beta-carotene hydroxylase n=1 Tax=Tahibacter aquaticus TaxID=520092 RepID=A0A4V3DMR1_9GAMM|nr:fatty acid desaturase [Tahibacter aquaticus]TDR45626.1 beta-carotene hydroxylase [Tahibacter aquaticus]
MNPTHWLCIVTLCAFYGSLLAFHGGFITLVTAAVINGISLYAMYSVTHDAVHGIAAPSKRLNDAMGRIGAFHEGLTFPIFKLSHMMHHRYTNDPQRDPDWVIGRRPRVLLPLWVVVRLLHDNSYMIRQGLWRGRPAHLAEHVLTLGAQVAYFGLLAFVFGTMNAVVLWIIPLAIAGAAVELLVAWLVHYPQESQERFEHTRLVRSRVLQVLMLNHNLHIVHHFWPRTPWFDYPARLPDAEHLMALAKASRATRAGAPSP